jgi:Fic family protein
MLRWEEKEDIQKRVSEVELAVIDWREREGKVPASIKDEFNEKLLISWIYHDAALEGEVLSYSEIHAATDSKIISDVTLIPAYEEIKAFNEACAFAMDHAVTKRKPVNVELFRKLYGLLLPDEAAKGCPYRKENPLHRLYYHEITQPDKIGYRMRKFGEWLEAEEGLHPIEHVAAMHQRFMAIFPWSKESGRVARIVSNLMLHRANYPLAVIHAIDRQRYYDSLRNDSSKLVSLYLEAVETTAKSATRVYDEAAARQARRRRRAS